MRNIQRQVRNLTYTTNALSFTNYATTPATNSEFTLVTGLEIDSAYPAELVGINGRILAYLDGGSVEYKLTSKYCSAVVTGDFFSNSKFGFQTTGGLATLQNDRQVLSFEEGLNLQVPVGFGSIDQIDVHVSPMAYLNDTPFVAGDSFRLDIDFSIIYNAIIYSDEG